MTHRIRGILYISSATFFWGLSATIGRAVFTGRFRFRGMSVGSIDPLILSQSRVTFTCLFLALLLLASGARQLRITAPDFWRMALLGVLGVAGANYFYYLAIQKTNVATAITIQYTAPVWVLFYMAFRGRQRATLQRIAAVVMCVVGISAAIGVFRGAHFDAMGVFAALLAAVACAVYNIGGHSSWPRTIIGL